MTTKAEQVHIRCSDSQRDAWEHAAKLDRRTLTDWIRIQLDDAAAKAVEKDESNPAKQK